MNKNSKKLKNNGYYQKMYDEYNNPDIRLDEYFNIMNEDESGVINKSELNAERKNKTLIFQGASFVLTVIIIISGILLYGANREYEFYDFFADIRAGRDENMPEAIPAAVYDKEILAELDARLYGPGGIAAVTSNESVTRIFKKYNMKYIDQHKDKMPNGCEAVSLTMVLSRYLPLITSQEIAEKYLPRKPMPVYSDGLLFADDPTDYYIGDPAGRGYGIFAPGLTKTAQAAIDANNLKIKAVDISGCSEEELFKYISEGCPVIVWITMRLAPVSWGAGESKWHLPGSNWKLYKWPSPMHCAVLVDFSETKVTLYDPTTGIVDYDKDLFLKRWNELGPYEDKTRQALVIK